MRMNDPMAQQIYFEFETRRIHMFHLPFLQKIDGKPYCKTCKGFVDLENERELSNLYKHGDSKEHKEKWDKLPLIVSNQRLPVKRLQRRRSRSKSHGMEWFKKARPAVSTDSGKNSAVNYLKEKRIKLDICLKS